MSMNIARRLVLLAALAPLAGCAASGGAAPAPSAQTAAPAAIADAPPPAAVPAPPVALDPARGSEIGKSYEGFLSPQQEPGEEEDAPAFTPKQFLSTEPSTPRNARLARGHGMVRFTKDLSRAFVEVKLENVNPQDVNMFHIHCGRPDMLGPILVDFALTGDLQANLADGVFTAEITNDHIVRTAEAGEGLVGSFTLGCPVVPGIPGDAQTIAGMAYIAEQNELYFNLHTKAQTFYGVARGQIYPVAP